MLRDHSDNTFIFTKEEFSLLIRAVKYFVSVEGFKHVESDVYNFATYVLSIDLIKLTNRNLGMVDVKIKGEDLIMLSNAIEFYYTGWKEYVTYTTKGIDEDIRDLFSEIMFLISVDLHLDCY